MARADPAPKASPASPGVEQTTETDEPATSLASPPPPSTLDGEEDANEKRKHRNRVAERKSRLTHKAQREQMAAQVHALECVLANIMFASDDAENTASWSELLLDDDESKRVRDFLRPIIPLEAEKVRLASEQSELRRLVRERVVAEDAFRRLLTEMNKEKDWDWRVMRWRALTLASFEPWSKAKCEAMVKDTLAYIGGFMANDDTITTGVSFMGWRDRRRLDKAKGTIEFSFYKTIHGNAEVKNDMVWSLHRGGDAYSKLLLGPNGSAFCEILQEIDENHCLVRVAETTHGSPVIVHMVVLLVRVFVGDACYLIRRTVPAPEVQAALSDPDAMWASNFYWTSHLVLERNASGECTQYMCSSCGTISSAVEAYTARWLTEVVFSLIRTENWTRGTQFLLK